MNRVKNRLTALVLVLTIIMLAGAAPAAALQSAFVPSYSYAGSEYYRRLLAVELTGDPRQDIVNIALSQEGYIEGGMEGDYSGSSRVCNNFSEYGYAMGENGSIWCTSFIWWCARQAGLDDSVFPDTIWPRLLTVNCPYVGYTATAAIQPGDLLFVENTGDDTSDHLSLVIEVTDTQIITIDGNCGNRVCRVKYDRDIGGRPDGLGNILYIGYPNYTRDPAVPDAASLMQYALVTQEAYLFNKHTNGVTQGKVTAGEVCPLLAVRGGGSWLQIERDGLAYWVDGGCAFIGSMDEVIARMSELDNTQTTTGEAGSTQTTAALPNVTINLPEAMATTEPTTTTTTAATTAFVQDIPEGERTQVHSDPGQTHLSDFNAEPIILAVLMILVLVVFTALMYSIKKGRG